MSNHIDNFYIYVLFTFYLVFIFFNLNVEGDYSAQFLAEWRDLTNTIFSFYF